MSGKKQNSRTKLDPYPKIKRGMDIGMLVAPFSKPSVTMLLIYNVTKLGQVGGKNDKDIFVMLFTKMLKIINCLGGVVFPSKFFIDRVPYFSNLAKNTF